MSNLTKTEVDVLNEALDDEKEHASVQLEWSRRKALTSDNELKDYLFTDKPIAHDQ